MGSKQTVQNKIFRHPRICIDAQENSAMTSQGHQGRFLADKTPTVAATSPACRGPPIVDF